MLWGRGNVPATPGQLRALLEDPLKKKLIYQLWTAQALSKLGEDDPEDASPLSDLTARQLVMIDEAAEAIDRECIPYDVDELATRPPSPPPHQLSPRTIIDRGEGQGEGQAAPDEGAPDEEAIQRRRVAEERRYRLVVELRRRSDEEAERQSAAAVSVERDRQQAMTPTCMPSCTAPPPPPTPLELLPLELLGLVLVFLPAVEDVAACLRAARLFGCAWGSASAEVAPTPTPTRTAHAAHAHAHAHTCALTPVRMQVPTTCDSLLTTHYVQPYYLATRYLATMRLQAALELRAAVAGETPSPPAGWEGSARAWLGWRERRRRAACWQELLGAGAWRGGSSE